MIKKIKDRFKVRVMSLLYPNGRRTMPVNGNSNIVRKLCRHELKVGDKVMARCTLPFNHGSHSEGESVSKLIAQGKARYIKHSR